MKMFQSHEIRSHIDADGHMVVASTSKNSTIEYCPESGAASYRRR
jgi:hypothetical protein